MNQFERYADDDDRTRADQFDEAHACARDLRRMMIHGRCPDDENFASPAAKFGVSPGGAMNPRADSSPDDVVTPPAQRSAGGSPPASRRDEGSEQKDEAA